MPFTRPSPRGWILIGACIVWFAAAAVQGNRIGLILGCAPLALVLASFVTCFFSLHGIDLQRGIAGDAVADHPVSLPVSLTNRYFLPRIPVVILEELPFAGHGVTATQAPALKPRESRVVDRRVDVVKRGHYTLDRLKLRGGDPAGLFFRERSLSRPGSILVLPGGERLTRLRLEHSHIDAGVGGTPMGQSGASQEIYGVREYNISDGLRNIHWKTSARYRRLMVREFDRTAVMSVTIVLDARKKLVSDLHDPWSNLESQVRFAASITRYLADMYCQLMFVAGGDHPLVLPANPSTDIKEKILYALAGLRAGDTSFLDLLYSSGEKTRPGGTLFCLSLNTEPEIETALALIESRGVICKWFSAPANLFKPRITDMLPPFKRNTREYRPAVPVVDITPKRSLNDVVGRTS